MKTKLWKLFMCAGFLSACGSNEMGESISTIQSYELQERRVPECGVESYKAGEHASCGIQSYKVARSPSCGVEKYNQVKSSKCPGYRAESTYGISKTTTCGGGDPRSTLKCNAGDIRFSYYAETEGCWKNAFDRGKRWKAKASCRITEIMNSCRLPEFGVEKYKSCAHSAHGVDRYKSCRHSSFGVEKYKSCQLRATTSEVEAKIASVKATYKDFALKLLQYQADYYAQIGGKQSLGCLITRYENDPLYMDVAADLKTLFAQTFGETFQGPYSCDLPVLTLDVCSAGDTSSKCVALVAYNKTRQWFADELKILKDLQEDIVARTNANIKGQLVTLSASLSDEALKAPVIDESVKKLILKKANVDVDQTDAIKYQFRYELECEDSNGAMILRSLGRPSGEDVVFNIADRLVGITAKCAYLVKGNIEGDVNWHSNLPGLFYGSTKFELSSNGSVSQEPSIYKVYSVSQ